VNPMTVSASAGLSLSQSSSNFKKLNAPVSIKNPFSSAEETRVSQGKSCVYVR